MKKRLTVNDVYLAKQSKTNAQTGKTITGVPFYGASSIFYDMFAVEGEFPWFTGTQSDVAKEAAKLDYDYISSSGLKLISPLLENGLVESTIYNDDESDEYLATEVRQNIAKVVIENFYPKWLALWDALNEEYNPLYNYDMTEEMTDDETVREYGKTTTRSPLITHTKTGTETDTPDVTETETPSVTRTDKIRGFNSDTDVNSGSSSSSGTRTNVRTGSDEVEYNITEEETGSETHTDSGEDTTTRNYALSFRGRVGNFAPSDLLLKEWEYRQRDYFRNVVFPDIDKILTLAIY